ncbi:ankyrin repeat-containing domain protein [Exophiala viscosa]|uniref:ankyrin repeat-containing domain protein n=1 Tax=Exophiala viscosa TaxID=2486360 RepID=UPI00219F1EDB|nr:ankyrin repeat-containing domain protein [Exophiala viscosa]
MGLDAVPREIFSRIIDTVLSSSNTRWGEGLGLRRVNRLWDHEIHAAYFDRTTVNKELDWHHYNPGVVHLYRYVLGRISSQREQNQFYTNIRATVDLLSSINLSWQEDAQTKIFAAIRCKIPAEAFVCHSDVEVLVVFGFLGLLREPKLMYLDRLERYSIQMEPWSWAMVTVILLNDVQLVKVLLEGKPERNAHKNELLSEPLRVAVTSKNYDLVTLFLENGAHLGCPPYYALSRIGCRTTLQYACVAGDVKMVEILRGPEYTIQTDCLTLDGAMDFTAVAIKNHRDREASYVRIMKCLVQTSDPEQQKGLREYAMYLGITHELESIVLMILGLGHDVDGHEGHSPLKQAASVGNLEIVEILLDHGATTSSDHKRDAIWSACMFEQPGVLEVLFKRAITVPEYGQSPLASHLLSLVRDGPRGQVWCHRFCLQVWKTCCHYGLDLTIDNCGQRALALATGPSFRLLREFLTSSLQSLQSSDSVMADGSGASMRATTKTSNTETIS